MLSHGSPEGHLRRPTSKMLQSHPSNLAPIVPLSPTSSISATPSPPAGFSLAWNWEMRQFVSEETFLCTKDCCRMDLNPNLQNLSIFNWCGGCLRCRTHHPCLDSHATPWKNVSSFNLAIWSVLVLYHLNQFYISYISNSTSTSNQSGWINWLGWKRLRFRWQHPDSRGKLDAVTWIPKRSLNAPYSSKMLQSHPSNLAPIVRLSPHLLDLGHTFTSCRLLLGLKLRDETICLGRNILCTKDCCRMDLTPNLQNLSYLSDVEVDS